MLAGVLAANGSPLAPAGSCVSGWHGVCDARHTLECLLGSGKLDSTQNPSLMSFSPTLSLSLPESSLTIIIIFLKKSLAQEFQSLALFLENLAKSSIREVKARLYKTVRL